MLSLSLKLQLVVPLSPSISITCKSYRFIKWRKYYHNTFSILSLVKSSLKSIKSVWINISNQGIHPGLDKRDIRITRLINRITVVIILIVLTTFLFQVIKSFITQSDILPQSYWMLATFLPFAIVLLLNNYQQYFLARMTFILLPLLTTVPWMFIDSSQAGMIHYLYLIFPIPIAILFRRLCTQIALVVISFLCFLLCNYILIEHPAIGTYSNPYFSLIVVGIWIFLSFLMLRFFVSEVEDAESILKQKNRELEEFSNVASHDMREPLRTIGSYASLIKNKYASSLPKEGSTYLGYIEGSVSRLDKLLSDLAEYSSIDSNFDEMEEVDLNNILQNVVRDLSDRIIKCDASVDIKLLPIVKGRRVHMYQLFQNLIANSLKFQDKEQTVIPEVKISHHLDGEYHKIIVEDNGIGIEQQYLEEIFKKFKRLHTKDKYEGTGLGLASCKRIMDLYKGKIEVESKLKVGTTIMLYFLR